MSSASPPAASLPRQDSEVETELKIALEEACLEAGVTLSATHFSPTTGFWLYEEPDAPSAGKLAGWFASARKRSFLPPPRLEKRKRSEPISPQEVEGINLSSEGSNSVTVEASTTEGVVEEEEEEEEVESSESSLKDRLRKATELDIRSGNFCWDSLLTVCRTEHMKSSGEDDQKCGTFEVTVNSGGVVYYALFQSEGSESGEAAACIKFAPSRLATQSELLGLELARHLGVQTPQARVIHSGSSEWSEIMLSVEKARDQMKAEENEIGENTSEELLEALNINRSLLLMGYIDGGPLLDCPEAFSTQEEAERSAKTLGRVLVLDLVLRNEDRLRCQQLGWRGNDGNLMATKKPVLGTRPHKERSSRPLLPRRGVAPGTANAKQPPQHQQYGFRKQLKTQFDSTSGRATPPSSGPPPATGADGSVKHAAPSTATAARTSSKKPQLVIVAIDSGVPRRPPSSKVEKDKTEFPKFVELLLNDETVAGQILQEISNNRLRCLPDSDSEPNSNIHRKKVVKAFQEGFRAGVHDMQDVRMVLLKLFRKLSQLLKEFVTYMASIEAGKPKEDSPSNIRSSKNGTSQSNSLSPSPSPSPSLDAVQKRLDGLTVGPGAPSGDGPDKIGRPTNLSKLSDSRQSPQTPPMQQESADRSESSVGRSFTPRTPPFQQDSPEQQEPSVGRPSRRSSSRERVRESWSGKLTESKVMSPQFSSRLTLKLKDVNKSAKVDGELCKELDWWDERIREEGKKICKEQDFTTGFLDHSSSHSLVDSYELKIRLDHLLERMGLIVHGIQTERPSCILKFLYIGGALAARSLQTLQLIGITDVLCLCPNEISMEDDYPASFEFKSFQVRDVENENIGQHFEEASSYIDSVEEKGGTILVHCFEGKSRSAAVVLAYLMLRKGNTLFQAWGLLKAAHARAQPNDGFMKILVNLDKHLHGKVSMDWQQKKPEIRMCPVCGKSAGISNSSLRQHLRRAHPDVTQVPMTTKNSPEAQQTENATAPLENLLSAVGV